MSYQDAAIQLVKFAHFHHAAELFLGRRIRPSALLREVLGQIEVDNDICYWLARNGPRRYGSEWSAFAYSQLLSPVERRQRGQFFTPRHIADFMTTWAIQSEKDRVLDPGTGPGFLLATAYHRLSTLGSREPSNQLAGVEISPLAPTFAALSLVPFTQRRPTIHIADFLGDFRRRAHYDAIVGNPPYSRHQLLPQEYKRLVSRQADSEIGEHLSQRAGIYVYFLIRSLALLREGGRLAFLIPRDFLDAQYGAALRRYLLRAAIIRGVVVFDPTNGSAFKDALTTSVVVLLERRAPIRSPIRVIHVRGAITSPKLMQALTRKGRRKYFPWGECVDIPFNQLAAASHWSPTLSHQDHSPQRGDEVMLKDLVRIKRGIATGANDFFVLSEQRVREAGLARSYLRPVISHARLAPNGRITRADFEVWKRRGERVWLLDVRSSPSKALRRYLAKGMKLGLHRRYLCRARRIWYAMERRDVPPILVTYMARGLPRFIRNQAGVLPLNVLHAIYPKELTQRQVDRLFTYFHSKACRTKLRRLARTYGSGLLKIEPGALLMLTVPDVRSR